jgi:hypothetical protein
MDASRVATLRGLVDQLAACEEALQGCVADAQRKLGPQGKFAPVTAQTHVILALARALGRVRPWHRLPVPCTSLPQARR